MIYTAKSFDLPEVEGLSKELLTTHLGLYVGYVTNTNTLLMELESLAALGETHAYAAAELRRRLGFEWNGMRLHELYFEALLGGSKNLQPKDSLYQALSEQFGDFTIWLTQFTKFSARGPGWALLCFDPATKQFFHVWVADHEIGHLATLPIILALDHWEHAYLRDYAPKDKTHYVEKYLSALNWEVLNARFENTSK